MGKPLTPEQIEARKEYQKKWRETNKDKLAKYHVEYREKNPEINKINTKNYRERNPEKSKNSSKKYKSNNKDKIKEYAKNYKERRYELHLEKMKTDPLYSIKENIRKSILKSFRRNNLKKNTKTQIILGCSFDEFKQYIELQFEDWMNWDNKGLYNGEFNYGWDIDHIIPISTGKTEDDIIKLNHYTNLQPLCSKINRDIKRDNL